MKRSMKGLWIVVGTALLLASCGENPLNWLEGNRGRKTGTIAGSAALYDRTGTSRNAPETHGGVTVSLEGTEFRTVTAADGSWTIAGVPQGIYTISYSREGYSPEKIVSYQFIGSGRANVGEKRMSLITNRNVTSVSFSKHAGTGIRIAPEFDAPGQAYVVFIGRTPDVSHLPGSHVLKMYNVLYNDIGAFFNPGERVYAVVYPASAYDADPLLYGTGKDPKDFPDYFDILAQRKSATVSLVF